MIFNLKQPKVFLSLFISLSRTVTPTNIADLSVFVCVCLLFRVIERLYWCVLYDIDGLPHFIRSFVLCLKSLDQWSICVSCCCMHFYRSVCIYCKNKLVALGDVALDILDLKVLLKMGCRAYILGL